MSIRIPFSALDSVDTAIGLVATRDLEPELDKGVYGIKTLSNASLNTTESKNYQNRLHPDKIHSKSTVPKTNATDTIKVKEGKMEMDPIISNNPKNLKSDESTSAIIGSVLGLDDGLESGGKRRLDLNINPTIYPPNNGNRVTSIDQLVNPLKWRGILYMFSSVPTIKDQINPIKFESVESRHSPLPTTTPSPTQSQSPINTSTSPKITIEPEVRGPIITMVEYEILDTVNIVEDRNGINQGWSILDVATRAIPPGWTNVFRASMPEFEHINRSLIKDEEQHGLCYPLRKNLFKAFDMCPLSNVKVVIVGQDPYHSDDHNGYPIAMGMSFSVNRGVTIPSSLNNIFKELARSIPNWNSPIYGDLSNWARQGVLMLNTCLTVRPHQAKSHKSLWMGFVAKIIASLNETNSHCIFVLWGREAGKIENLLTNKNVVLTAPHPSGLSAYKGFIGCNHFVDINIELEKQGKRAINWTV